MKIKKKLPIQVLLKTSIIILVLVCGTFSRTFSQNLAFQKLYCKSYKEFAILDFLPMHTGSIFVVGGDTINFAGTQGSAVIRKFDKDFNLLWERKYGGSGAENFNLIKYIGDNRLLVRGVSTSLDGDVLNNNNFGNNEWVCVIDTNGNILHQLIYSGAGNSSWNIRIAPNGDFFFCGSTDGNAYDFVGNGPFDFQIDGYIACTDSLLNKKWLKFFEVNGQQNSDVLDVNFLPNGHLLMVCSSTINADAFPTNAPTSNGYCVIMEMDTLYNIYWQKRYGQASIKGGQMGTIYKDPNKWEYYLCGFAEEKDGDCWDSYPYLSKGDQDYHWLMKVDTLGNKLWSHVYGPFSDNHLDGLDFQSELFNGNTLHFADGAFGSDNYDFGTQIGTRDSWLIDIDSNGIMYTHHRVGYPNVRWAPQKVKLNVLTNEKYYLYNETKAFGDTLLSPNACETTNLVTNYIMGKYNYWPTDVNTISSDRLSLNVYPNPAKNEIFIEKLDIGTVIEIYTADGKKMIQLKASKRVETISVSTWPRGTYLVKANYKKQVFSQKVILQ